MAGSYFGNSFRITTWGESHGPAIGVVIDGCPAGLALSAKEIQCFLDRRKPGQSRYTTQRNESDQVEILSGVFEGRTTGTPISLIVRNQDQRSKDYGNIASSTVPDMPTLLLTASMDSVTIAEVVVLPGVRRSAVSLPVLLPPNCSQKWGLLSWLTPSRSDLLPFLHLNII